jgi:hypothetical protein
MTTYQVVMTYLLGVAIIVVILWQAIPEETNEDEIRSVYDEGLPAATYYCPKCMRRYHTYRLGRDGRRRCTGCRDVLRQA